MSMLCDFCYYIYDFCPRTYKRLMGLLSRLICLFLYVFVHDCCYSLFIPDVFTLVCSFLDELALILIIRWSPFSYSIKIIIISYANESLYYKVYSINRSFAKFGKNCSIRFSETTIRFSVKQKLVFLPCARDASVDGLSNSELDCITNFNINNYHGLYGCLGYPLTVASILTYGFCIFQLFFIYI